MKYNNINNNSQIILSEDKVYTKKELIYFFIQMLNINEISYQITNIKKTPYVFNFFIDNSSLSFYVYLKNITGAGWAQKPDIKRIQITNPRHDLNLKQNEDRIILALGYYNFDNNPIWVAWDTQRYTHHKTIRSCYVIINNLKRGYEKRYLEAVDSSQKVWLFTSENMNKFLINYINDI